MKIKRVGRFNLHLFHYHGSPANQCHNAVTGITISSALQGDTARQRAAQAVMMMPVIIFFFLWLLL
jgi:hypothetical protein